MIPSGIPGYPRVVLLGLFHSFHQNLTCAPLPLTPALDQNLEAGERVFIRGKRDGINNSNISVSLCSGLFYTIVGHETRLISLFIWFYGYMVFSLLNALDRAQNTKGIEMHTNNY